MYFQCYGNQSLSQLAPCHLSMALLRVAVVGNTLKEQSLAANKRSSFSLGLVEGLSASEHQNRHFIKCHNCVTLGQSFGPPKQWNLVDG
jgi:hypothetical protein